MPGSQILHFAEGETHKFMEVQLLDDNVPEGDEKFQLILANPSFGLELGHNTTGSCYDALVPWDCCARG